MMCLQKKKHSGKKKKLVKQDVRQAPYMLKEGDVIGVKVCFDSVVDVV